MEREILFRGKHDPKYGVGWCYGVPYTDHDGDCIMATNISRRVVIKETVGQYTDLTDKNGVKIFEGDILKIRDKHQEYFSKVYTAYGVPFCIDIKIGDYNFQPLAWADVSYEVIGNVFDNPELLGGEPNV